MFRQRKEEEFSPKPVIRAGSSSSNNSNNNNAMREELSSLGNIVDEKTMAEFEQLYSTEMIENNSRKFMETYWIQKGLNEKTLNLVTFLRDVIFRVPHHEERELQQPETTPQTNRQRFEDLFGGITGNTPSIGNLMQLLTGLSEPVSDAKVQTDECIEIGSDWLDCLLCYGQMQKEGYYKKILTTNRGVCGKTWTVGQIAFKCKTCQMDPTCAICEECFKKGNHEGHDYSMTRNSNGMCDCGDVEAWNVAGFCCDHTGRSDPLAHLTVDYKELLTAIIKGLFSKEGVINNYIRQITIKFKSLSDEQTRKKSFQLQTLYQNFKHILGTILENINSSPCLKRLAYMELKEFKNGSTFLDEIILSIPSMSQPIKYMYSDLFLALITDIDFKVFFSERFIAHYSLIIEDYKIHLTKKKELSALEEEEKSVHISSLSVQLLTTPTVATHLIENCNLVSILLDTLIESVEDEAVMDDLRNNRLVYRPQSNSRKVEALYHIIFDIHYCVMHQKFSDEILLNEDCYHKFLTFLSYLQATTDIRRLDSDESKWYTSFNLEMGTLPKIIRNVTSFIEGYADDSKYKSLLNQLLGTLTKFIQDDNLEIEKDGTVKVNPFNIPITYNLPLHRFGTTIFKNLMSRFPAISLKSAISEVLEQTTPNSPQVTNQFLIQLLDHPLKTYVTTAQINARLWQRNHEHILEQSFNYNSESFGDYTYCNDIFLIQIITGLLNDHEIIYRTLVKKFNNSLNELKLFTTEKLKEDEDKRSILEEEFVRLVILMSTNRVLMDSMSNFDICRKYVLHYLFSEDKCKFSDIVAYIPKSFRTGIDIKVIVNEVANFHKPKGSQDQGYFTVKSNYWDEFDPYFIGINSQLFYQAVEHYKTQTSSKRFPPICLEKPIFAANQQLENGLTGLMLSNILYKIIFFTMYRTIKWRKESSQEQLPAFILHLLLLSLNHVSTGQDILQTVAPSKKSLFSPINSYLDIPFKDGESPLKYILQPIEDDDGNEYSIIKMLFEFESQGEIVTRVFNRLIELNETCDKMIVEAKSKKESTNNKVEKEAKKKRALANRQKVLEKMNASQKMFAQSLEEDEEAVDDTDKLKCAFCHDHKSPEGNESLSLLCQIVNNPFPQITRNKENTTLYGNIQNKPIVDIGELTEAFADVNKEHNAQINFCSHACHADCFDRYYSNLVQEEHRRRRFKGFGQISLDSMEILCPICSRVANCLCPIVSNQSELLQVKKTSICTSLPSLETIASFMKDVKIKEMDEDVKTSTTLSTVCEKIINKKKEDLGDTLDPMPTDIEPFERVDSAYFSNTFSSEIAVEEILQRSQPHLQPLSESTRKSLNHVFGLLISFQQLNEKNRGKTLQEINAVVGSMMGLKSYGNVSLYDEGHRERKMYLPFLSGDMFTLFVRLTTLLFSSEKKIDSNMFRDLLVLFYISHLIQIIMQCNLRLQQTFSTGVPSMDRAISSIENIPIFERFELRNLETDLVLSESAIPDMSNGFLRRVALYYSLLFPEEEMPTEESEHVNLTKYLHLPTSEQLLAMVRESPSYAELITKWIEQVKSSMQSLSKALSDEIQDEEDEDLYVFQADSLIPCFSAPKPFKFIELPRLYEDLVLKYHNAKCPNCSKKLENPAICLITGELVWLKQCSCESYICGKITRYTREKYSGFGLFLVIKSSRILLMHEGRSGILHSPYLDSNGEEDKNLKRGVPLFFHIERLEEIIHRLGRMTFDHDTIILEKCSNLQTHVL